MAGWEVLAPRRKWETSKATRWLNNLAISLINTMVLRMVFVVGVTGVALLAQQHGWGVLNFVTWPEWTKILIAIIILDFVVYAQHVAFHKIPVLWRLHKVHHSDMDFDVTTAVRFHPMEILISMLIKIGAVLGIGASSTAVLIFEILLNGMALFNHSNVRIPSWIDRRLRWILVTPDMHRVHHSVMSQEMNSNYGFNLPWWDRLLKMYQSQPCLAHETMTIGLEQFRNPRKLTLWHLLCLPFIAEPTGGLPHDSDHFTRMPSAEGFVEQELNKKEEVLTS